MITASAFRSTASSAVAKSLSITASTPTSRRPAGAGSSVYMTGMPPPPAQMTTQPFSSSHSSGSSPKMRCGKLVGLVLLVDRADRLRRVRERRIRSVDLDERQQRRESYVDRQLVAE